MPDLRLKTALGSYGHTAPLKDGRVHPRTCALEFEETPTIIQAFRRMVRGLDFDVAEMAITTYLCARAHGKAFTAIPVFPMRAFHHGAILYNAQHGPLVPKELEGKRVGVNRGYTVTTGLWARSILQHEHGVDLSKVTWVLSGDEHVAEYRPPANVVPIAAGQTLENLLLSGEIAALSGAPVDAPGVRPLIADHKAAGLRALRERGLYPINHTIVVRDDVLAAHPEVGADLFEAFVAAKRIYVDRLAADLEPASKSDETYRQVLEITGDPLPYGIEPNRHVLEAIIRYSVEQGIISQPFTVDEIFAPGTRSLVG